MLTSLQRNTAKEKAIIFEYPSQAESPKMQQGSEVVSAGMVISIIILLCQEPIVMEVAIAQLRRTLMDLMKLSESVHLFAAWWTRMELVVSTAEIRSDSLKYKTGQNLTIEAMRGGWCQINEDYSVNKVKVYI
jgi:hypothetical protein